MSHHLPKASGIKLKKKRNTSTTLSSNHFTIRLAKNGISIAAFLLIFSVHVSCLRGGGALIVSTTKLYLLSFPNAKIYLALARVVKLAYTRDLKSLERKIARAGSTPASGTLRTGCSSSVERSVWDREAQGSIPCTPTE